MHSGKAPTHRPTDGDEFEPNDTSSVNDLNLSTAANASQLDISTTASHNPNNLSVRASKLSALEEKRNSLLQGFSVSTHFNLVKSLCRYLGFMHPWPFIEIPSSENPVNLDSTRENSNLDGVNVSSLTHHTDTFSVAGDVDSSFLMINLPVQPNKWISLSSVQWGNLLAAIVTLPAYFLQEPAINILTNADPALLSESNIEFFKTIPPDIVSNKELYFPLLLLLNRCLQDGPEGRFIPEEQRACFKRLYRKPNSYPLISLFSTLNSKWFSINAQKRLKLLKVTPPISLSVYIALNHWAEKNNIKESGGFFDPLQKITDALTQKRDLSKDELFIYPELTTIFASNDGSNLAKSIDAVITLLPYGSDPLLWHWLVEFDIHELRQALENTVENQFFLAKCFKVLTAAASAFPAATMARLQEKTGESYLYDYCLRALPIILNDVAPLLRELTPQPNVVFTTFFENPENSNVDPIGHIILRMLTNCADLNNTSISNVPWSFIELSMQRDEHSMEGATADHVLQQMTAFELYLRKQQDPEALNHFCELLAVLANKLPGFLLDWLKNQLQRQYALPFIHWLAIQENAKVQLLFTRFFYLFKEFTTLINRNLEVAQNYILSLALKTTFFAYLSYSVSIQTGTDYVLSPVKHSEVETNAMHGYSKPHTLTGTPVLLFLKNCLNANQDPKEIQTFLKYYLKLFGQLSFQVDVTPIPHCQQTLEESSGESKTAPRVLGTLGHLVMETQHLTSVNNFIEFLMRAATQDSKITFLYLEQSFGETGALLPKLALYFKNQTNSDIEQYVQLLSFFWGNKLITSADRMRSFLPEVARAAFVDSLSPKDAEQINFLKLQAAFTMAFTKAQMRLSTCEPTQSSDQNSQKAKRNSFTAFFDSAQQFFTPKSIVEKNLESLLMLKTTLQDKLTFSDYWQTIEAFLKNAVNKIHCFQEEWSIAITTHFGEEAKFAEILQRAAMTPK